MNGGWVSESRPSNKVCETRRRAFPLSLFRSRPKKGLPSFLPSFLPSSPFQSIALLHSCTHPHTQAHEVHVHRIACRHFGEIGGGGAFLWFDSFFYRISQRSRSDSITWMALLLLLLLRVSLVGTLQPSSFVVRQALFYFTAILPVQKKIVCPSVQNCKLWLCAVTPRTLTMR